mmetsp:Transcript_7379/g.13485  ORF Transcript_7379/g.13485 Transcript_7379/m.13485 type:complete len:99 (-) Transcript_7379:228-524(-)
MYAFLPWPLMLREERARHAITEWFALSVLSDDTLDPFLLKVYHGPTHSCFPGRKKKIKLLAMKTGQECMISDSGRRTKPDSRPDIAQRVLGLNPSSTL